MKLTRRALFQALAGIPAAAAVAPALVITSVNLGTKTVTLDRVTPSRWGEAIPTMDIEELRPQDLVYYRYSIRQRRGSPNAD